MTFRWRWNALGGDGGCCTGWSLDELRYRYRSGDRPRRHHPDRHLRALVESGAREPSGRRPRTRSAGDSSTSSRWSRSSPAVLPDRARHRSFAGARIYQGGGGHEFGVCFCLGITAVDPTRIDMLFEQFIGRERDIPRTSTSTSGMNVARRSCSTCTSGTAAIGLLLVAEVISYRGRTRPDVGKVLGLSEDLVQQRATNGGAQPGRRRSRDLGVDPTSRRLRPVRRRDRFPRHLSSTSSSSSRIDRSGKWFRPPRWRMDGHRVGQGRRGCDGHAQGRLPVSGISWSSHRPGERVSRLVRRGTSSQDGPAPPGGHSIPAEDEKVYDMICRADTVEVFESVAN